MSFTFTTLKQAIQDFAENNETSFVNNLSLFITTAEERIFKMVDLEVFRKNVSASTTSSNKFLALPSDYLATFSLSLKVSASSPLVFLSQKDVSFLQEFDPSGSTGFPRYYAHFDVDNLILAPTPDQAYTAELHYYYRPPSITQTSDGTSWLGTNAPDVLLYACLMEAYTYMKGEADMLQLYQQRFAEGIARLKNYGEGRENTDAFRTGLVLTNKT
jgi:hypothetical protein